MGQGESNPDKTEYKKMGEENEESGSTQERQKLNSNIDVKVTIK